MMSLNQVQEYSRERVLLRKLDFFILTFCCLMNFTSLLDKSNLTNAYVSGMKEDLRFIGNQFNQVNTVFTVGFVIGQIPSNLALYHLRPRIFFPCMMTIWSILTMCTATVHHPREIMTIRFFQGIAESGVFVGTHYILGSWYTPREIGKRSSIFTSSGLAGNIIGGFLQTAIHSSLNGAHGISGWRWLFIIDGLITLPIAVYGLFFFPDTPSTTSAFYLSSSERSLAVSRVPKVAKRSPWNLAFLRRVFTSWYWYGFTFLWILSTEAESFSNNSLLAIWMKYTQQYSMSQLNNYPTGVQAVGIASTLFWGALTDSLGGKRYLVGYWVAITGIATSVMILTTTTNTGIIFAAYFWAGSIYACQATFYAWANDIMRWEEDSLRAVVIASMNCGSNVVYAWWSIIFYSVDMAPRFTKGMWAMIGTCIAMAFWTSGILYWTTRAKRKRTLDRSLDSGEENFEAESDHVTKV